MIKIETSPSIAPVVVSELMREHPGVRLIDVRTPAEFESSHIPGAYNVPLDTLGEHAREISLVRETPIMLVCQSGARARKADDSLRASGMDNLRLLEGGMNAWIADGLSVVRGPSRMSLERQVRIAAGSMAAAGGILALTLNPLFAIIPAFVGSGLVFAGVTDTCAMGLLLARLKYNRSAACDPAAVVRAFQAGMDAPLAQKVPLAAATTSCSSS